MNVYNQLPPTKLRVLAFIDGFNLYHALDNYDFGATAQEKARYQKYKWLCLTSLMKRFIQPKTETLIGVEYFTAYPGWYEPKRLRHRVYVSAQIRMGVHVTFGEFKQKTIACRAYCYEDFQHFEEKQTDVNIATSMIDMRDRYDKLLLITADSDQVPALKLIKRNFPNKILATLPPIGRSSKELWSVCDQSFQMTEQHLIDCQLPNPIPLIDKSGKQYGVLEKPSTWP